MNAFSEHQWNMNAGRMRREHQENGTFLQSKILGECVLMNIFAKQAAMSFFLK